ncbi:mechanosensitive ion channel family protein [Halobacteriovorax sp.]|uniref:mechanosensitive ion channel family protein n=1 Tax=Halobacteriovorax sp. TaxID=2020862 RepID=UPI003564A95E
MTKLFLIIGTLFLHTQVFASNYPSASLESPRSTMNYFLKTMKGFKKGDQEGLDLAIKALNTSELDPTSRVSTAKLAAKRLINTIDRLEYIDINSIPTDLKDQNLWIYKKERIIENNRELFLEISIGQDTDKKWKFTPQTLASIQDFESSVRNNSVAKGVIELTSWKSDVKKIFPAWTGQRSFILLNGQWMALFALVFFGHMLERLIRLIIISRVKTVFEQQNIRFKEQSEGFFSPQGFFFFSIFWIFGLELLELPDTILGPLLRIGYVAFTVASVFSLTQIVDVVCQYLEQKALESENKFDDVLIPLIRKSSKFIIYCFGIIFIGDSLTLDMKNILAGLGIGGVAFAFAAKDTISNLFGSLTVLLDRPFSIGDWVVVDSKVEGTVVEVGLRSTRIKTFYDSIISVPNGTLINASVDNLGKRTYRRFNTNIGVQYDTPVEKIEAFCEGIRQIILSHKWTRKDYFHVYFNSMGDSSLQILLYVFWRVPDWSAELQERHRLLIDILRLGKDLGIDFAFPTQTLHLYNEEHKPVSNTDFEALVYGKDLASKITENPISTKHHRSGKIMNNDISL